MAELDNENNNARKRGRPSKASQSQDNIDNDEGDSSDAEGIEQELVSENVGKATIDVPNADGSIKTEDIKFDNDKGFNDIPEEEFDLLGETTEKRGYASGGGTGTNNNAPPTAESEAPIPEPVYAEQNISQNSGFKNEFTESPQANSQSSQDQARQKEQEKQQKEQAKANSNMKDLSTSEKKEAAAKTAKGLTQMYVNLRPAPFIYFSEYDTKALKKSHENNEIDLDAEISRNGTTLRDSINSFNTEVYSIFQVKPETQAQIEEAVFDLCMEKEIALTPAQRLGVAVGLDLIGCAFEAAKLISQRKTDLEEQKIMHAERMAAEAKRYQPAHHQENPQPKPPATPPPAQPQQTSAPVQQPVAQTEVKEVKITMEDAMNSEMVISPIVENSNDIPTEAIIGE